MFGHIMTPYWTNIGYTYLASTAQSPRTTVLADANTYTVYRSVAERMEAVARDKPVCCGLAVTHTHRCNYSVDCSSAATAPVATPYCRSNAQCLSYGRRKRSGRSGFGRTNNNNNNNNTSICKAHNVSIRAESEAPAVARWRGWLEG